MKQLTRRAVICLALAAILAAGVLLFVFRYFRDGRDWVGFAANDHLYSQGVLKKGKVLDTTGRFLAKAEDGYWSYSDDWTLRRATVHVTGDYRSTISTGAISAFAGKLSGYHFLTGARTLFPGGRTLYLTVDAALNATALEAMQGYNGTVAVYDYTTGQVRCLVSAPTYDPADPPEIVEGDHTYDGIYINNFLSAAFIPGSIFKLVTAAAAIDHTPNLENRNYTCTGSVDIDGHTITCTQAHGEENFGQALTNSCNCYFGLLAVELGEETLSDYVKQCGLTDSYSLNGVVSQPSSFDFDSERWELAWSGVGQGYDLVNPCSFLVYLGAIANGGRAAQPQLISKIATEDDLRLSIYTVQYTDRLLGGDTASQLKQMMKDNVINKYGADNFYGLSIGAKSGTAETDDSDQDNAWFAGFVDGDSTLAFVVYLEGAGFGADLAARVANQVLQAAVEAGY